MHANKGNIILRCLSLLLLLMLNVSHAAYASSIALNSNQHVIKQDVSNTDASIEATNTTEPKSFWRKLWGQPAMEPTLALGMWSFHLKNESKDMDNSRNDLIGVGYHGGFIGTLVNSQDRRSYVVGIQRYWMTDQLKPDLTLQLGYRLGLIYGYDKRFGHIAQESPVLPFPQVIADFTWKHIGWEFSYTWVVVSTGFYIRF